MQIRIKVKTPGSNMIISSSWSKEEISAEVRKIWAGRSDGIGRVCKPTMLRIFTENYNYTSR